MIKELIFQKQKWYQGDVPNYIGKTIQAPDNIITCYMYPDDFSLKDKQDLQFRSMKSVRLKEGQFTKVYGQISSISNEIYLFVYVHFHNPYNGDYGWEPYFIKLDDLIKNGGSIE